MGESFAGRKFELCGFPFTVALHDTEGRMIIQCDWVVVAKGDFPEGMQFELGDQMYELLDRLTTREFMISPVAVDETKIYVREDG